MVTNSQPLIGYFSFEKSVSGTKTSNHFWTKFSWIKQTHCTCTWEPHHHLWEVTLCQVYSGLCLRLVAAQVVYALRVLGPNGTTTLLKCTVHITSSITEMAFFSTGKTQPFTKEILVHEVKLDTSWSTLTLGIGRGRFATHFPPKLPQAVKIQPSHHPAKVLAG